MKKQTAIPCTLMRGGTSRGPYFLASDLPQERTLQDQVLSAAMGSGNAMQINGVGGGSTLTSKTAIVAPSSHPDADIDYLFAQVSVEETRVDVGPSCGNILAGVGPFAIEKGLVVAQEGETTVRVRNLNTNSFIEVVVKTEQGEVVYDGDTTIDGVPGTAAPVILNFLDVAGSKTGTLLPTGRVRDRIDGIDVSCVDAAVPMVLFKASDLGVTGQESKAELDANAELLARMEAIRRQASVMMGLGDAEGRVIPKMALLSPARFGGTLTSRYFVPFNCHGAHAVTGAICVASACVLEGSVAHDLVSLDDGDSQPISIEHPSGKIDVVLELERLSDQISIRRAGLVRTARKIMDGTLYVSADIWSPGIERIA